MKHVEPDSKSCSDLSVEDLVVSGTACEGQGHVAHWLGHVPEGSSGFKVGLRLWAWDPFHELQGRVWLVPGRRGRAWAIWTIPMTSVQCHQTQMWPRKPVTRTQLFTGGCQYPTRALWHDLMGWGRWVCYMKADSHLIFAKDISLGNAEQQGIGNLPSGAGHQDSNGIRLWDTRREDTAVSIVVEDRYECDGLIVQHKWAGRVFVSTGFSRASSKIDSLPSHSEPLHNRNQQKLYKL